MKRKPDLDEPTGLPPDPHTCTQGVRVLLCLPNIGEAEGVIVEVLNAQAEHARIRLESSGDTFVSFYCANPATGCWRYIDR